MAVTSSMPSFHTLYIIITLIFYYFFLRRSSRAVCEFWDKEEFGPRVGFTGLDHRIRWASKWDLGLSISAGIVCERGCWSSIEWWKSIVIHGRPSLKRRIAAVRSFVFYRWPAKIKDFGAIWCVADRKWLNRIDRLRHPPTDVCSAMDRLSVTTTPLTLRFLFSLPNLIYYSISLDCLVR